MKKALVITIVLTIIIAVLFLQNKQIEEEEVSEGKIWIEDGTVLTFKEIFRKAQQLEESFHPHLDIENQTFERSELVIDNVPEGNYSNLTHEEIIQLYEILLKEKSKAINIYGVPDYFDSVPYVNIEFVYIFEENNINYEEYLRIKLWDNIVEIQSLSLSIRHSGYQHIKRGMVYAETLFELEQDSELVKYVNELLERE